MVYSYGGDLTDGKSSTYDFGWLAQNSGQIVVSMNYRVNLFGFLALRELSTTAPTGVSGNYGFHDQLEALRWVQANAMAMGGDPERVTFFGQSSGGTSVYALLASEQAKGLFTRAISLSGSTNLTMDLPTAETQNVPVQAALGCGSDTIAPESDAAVVKCLQNRTILDIQKAVPASWNTVKALWSLPPASAATRGMDYQGIAIVDGDLIKQPLQEALRAGVNTVPLIVSSMAQETDAQPGQIVSADTGKEFQALVDAAFQPWGTGTGQRVLEAYASDAAAAAGRSNTNATLVTSAPAVGGGDHWQRVYDSIMADYGQTCASIPTALAASGVGRPPVYELYISATPSHPIWGFDTEYQPRYALHSLDILAGLGHWDLWSAGRGLPPFEAQASDKALRAAMLAILTNFTRNGKLDEAAGWAQVTAGCPRTATGKECYTVINVTESGVPVATSQLRQTVCDFWTDLGFDQRFWWSN